MRAFLAYLKKDLRSEFRLKETIGLLVFLALLFCSMLALGVSGAFLSNNEKLHLFPSLLWVISIFTATLCLGKTFDYEREHAAYETLYLFGGKPNAFFLAKFITNYLLSIISNLLCYFTLGALMGIALGEFTGQFVLISLLVLFGYSALATLLSALTCSSRLRSMLLPVILLPLLFPLFFAANELSISTLEGTPVSLSDSWASLILGLDLLYGSLALLLFPATLRD